jgi:hypothetical protein
MSGDPPSTADDVPSRSVSPDRRPSRLSLSLYVLAIAAAGGVAVGLSYLAFASGFVENVDAILTDPVGTVQEQTLGLVAFLGSFVAVGVLLVVVVVVGSRYLHVVETPTDDRP